MCYREILIRGSQTAKITTDADTLEGGTVGVETGTVGRVNTKITRKTPGPQERQIDNHTVAELQDAFKANPRLLSEADLARFSRAIDRMIQRQCPEHSAPQNSTTATAGAAAASKVHGAGPLPDQETCRRATCSQKGGLCFDAEVEVFVANKAPATTAPEQPPHELITGQPAPWSSKPLGSLQTGDAVIISCLDTTGRWIYEEAKLRKIH